MRLVLLLLLCAPAPGDDPARRFAGLLDEKVPFDWIEAGLEPLRRGRTAIREGRAQRLEQPVAYARIDAADVVLVADLHEIDAIRTAFARIVARHAGKRDTALALEAVPPRLERAYAKAANKHAAIRACWPWPVDAYADVVGLDKPVLAVGIDAEVGMPGPDVADADRRPGIRIAPPGEDPGHDLRWRFGRQRAAWYARHEYTTKRIRSWVAEKKGRKVFALYGAAHHLEPHAGLRDALVAAGLEVVVVVPLLPDWERVLDKRAAKHWLEVLPGVLRAPR